MPHYPFECKYPPHFVASFVKWGNWSAWMRIGNDIECSQGLYKRQRQCYAVIEATGSTVTCGDCKKGEIDIQQQCASKPSSIHVYHSIMDHYLWSYLIVQEYSDWSGRSSTSCQGTELVYERSRVCVPVTPSATPSPIILLCNGEEDDVEYRKETDHIACPKGEHVALVVGLVVVALLCISLGLLFTCLCIREWSKRKTYDIR